MDLGQVVRAHNTAAVGEDEIEGTWFERKVQGIGNVEFEKRIRLSCFLDGRAAEINADGMKAHLVEDVAVETRPTPYIEDAPGVR